MADGMFGSLYPVREAESKKSSLRKLFEKVTGAGETSAQIVKHAEATGHALRQYTEEMAIGGLLGAFHSWDPQKTGTGLDVVVRKASGLGGADGKTVDPKTNALMAPKPAMTVPADLALAGLGLVGSLMLAHKGVDGVSTDLRNAGAAAGAIFAFRKGADLMAAKKRKEQQQQGGTVPSLVSLQREANKASGATAHGEFGADPIVSQAQQLLGVG